MKKKFYGIKKGKKSNIVVRTWDECSKLVTGCSGAIFKGFQFESDAISFAKTGNYGKHTPKAKVVDVVKPWGTCIERKSYKDPFTGVYYKNRCVVKFIARVVGFDYKPSNEDSAPWVIQ